MKIFLYIIFLKYKFLINKVNFLKYCVRYINILIDPNKICTI